VSRPRLSVIIPTCNRCETLAMCLQALADQRLAAGAFETLVVDDGSSDRTGEVARGMASAGVRYLKQPNRGPAAARNTGIRSARGDIVLFIGDDILATADLVGEHLRWHTERYPGEHVAVLGRVTWSPRLTVSPFMHWLEHGGPQFGFYRFIHDRPVPPGDLYTANVSYKRAFLEQNGLFDEDFPHAAFEDSELGLRLAARGLVGVYHEGALGYHHHPITFSSYCRRMETVGISSVVLCEKLKRGDPRAFRHGSRARKWLKALGYPLARAVLTRLDAHGVRCRAAHYLRVLEYHRIRGIEAALSAKRFQGRPRPPA
jgi:glycosyltransferase involved in cell wall biosynthesis